MKMGSGGKKNKLMNQSNIPDHHLGALAESEADLGQD